MLVKSKKQAINQTSKVIRREFQEEPHKLTQSFRLTVPKVLNLNSMQSSRHNAKQDINCVFLILQLFILSLNLLDRLRFASLVFPEFLIQFACLFPQFDLKML